MKPKGKFKHTEIGPIPEDWKDSDIFITIIKNFLNNEKFILNNDLNERTISYKLAEYIQKEFSSYDVDCEYNKMQNGEDPKKYTAKTLDLDAEEISSNDEKGITVYPDIIIHKRGNNENNYLIIEIKKNKYANEKRKKGESYRDFDFRKLKAYTKETTLNYTYGIYLEFEGNTICELKFFQKGNLLDDE